MCEVQAQAPAPSASVRRAPVPRGRGWAYDPAWNVFVHDGTRGQQVVLGEAAERDITWASEVGLDADTQAHLRANPTPGCYHGGSPK